MDSLIIEELPLLNKTDVELIEKETKLKVLSGIKVLVHCLPLVLKNIYGVLNEDLKEKEVLIIGDDEELTKEVIESLYKEVRFITLAGDYENSIEDISKYILEKTGLSIFYSKNIEKILKNYSIIINLKSKAYIDISKLRGKTMIFDLSIEKGLKGTTNSRKGSVIIEDFMFKASDLNIGKNKWIEDLVSSYIYEHFYPLKIVEPEGFIVNGNLYDIKYFIDYKIRKKTVGT